MTKTRKLVAIGAGLAAVMLPVTAMAQEAPEVPDSSDEVRTGTRIQTIEVIGAIRDARAQPRAELPADRSLPELPVTYEDEPGK